MADIPEGLLYGGVSIDVAFGEPRPHFGDLLRLCGETAPHWPPTGSVGFQTLADLRFTWQYDRFEVRSCAGEGTDASTGLVVRLYPLWCGDSVPCSPSRGYRGPLDGLRLDYNVLFNPAHRAEHYLRCVREITALVGVAVRYRSRGLELGTPPDLSPVRADIEAVVRYWASQGVTVGSDEALPIRSEHHAPEWWRMEREHEAVRAQAKAENLLNQLQEGRARGRVTDRKTRLLLCAWVRQGVWPLLQDARSRAAVEVAERFADGQADDAELKAAAGAAGAATSAGPLGSPRPTVSYEGTLAFAAASSGVCSAPWATTWSLAAAPAAVARYGRAANWHFDDLLASLFADIVSPESLPAVDPAWLSWNDRTVPKLAQIIYDGRHFEDLPVLADALMDPGCQAEAVLGHCRSQGLHARGCWVIDLLLGAR